MEVTFTTRIDQLHQENFSLACELDKCRAETVSECKKRQTAEDEVMQLKLQIWRMQSDQTKLKSYVKEWKSRAEILKKDADTYQDGLDKIYTIIEKIK